MQLNPQHSRYWVPMVGHTFRALEAFEDASIELSLQEVSTRAGISKSSAYRILFTLENLGYVNKNSSTGKYHLGLKILEAARKVRAGCGLVQVSRPFLEELRDRFTETVNLAVLQNDQIVYVEIFESSHSFRMTGEVGSRAPLHATAIGKSIAAFQDRSRLKKLVSLNPFKRFTPHTLTRQAQFMKSLEEVRLQGYSLDEEEIELGACCLAAPILNNAGVAVAAMSIAGPAPRIRQKQQAIIDGLRKAAAEISARLELL
jgi:IclR family transcriptional regulator, KDG regulon repressor